MIRNIRIYILFAVLFCTLSFSCTKLLDENPRDQVFVENFFETENDAISAINSIYAVLNSTSVGPTFGGVYHSSYWVSMGLTSDEMENRLPGAIDLDEMDQFSHKPVNPTMYDFWRNAYKGISNANFAIEGIPNVNMDEALQRRLLGEARFLRGLLYLDLVRIFGDVPLILTFEGAELFPARTAKEQVYDAIIEDLLFAESNLPTSYPAGDGKGRATSGAAKGLLAKTYLNTKEYALCIQYCNEIMGSGNYQLWPTFDEVFRIPNTNGIETLFNVGFGTANNSISFWEVGQFNVRLLPRQLSAEIPGINAQGWQVATQHLFDSFDDLDRRKAVTFITEINQPNGNTLEIEPHIRKYWDEIAEPLGGNTENDFPYLRYADILLIFAEAVNEQSGGPNAEAYEAINTVRRRARFDGTQEQDVLPDLNNLNYEQFRDAILEERRKEFVAEGHRWLDLARFEKLTELVPLAKPGVQPQPFHRLFPIPQDEIDLNQNLLPQNPGY